MRKGDSGADYSHARPPVSWLKGHNLTFVCRYLLDNARNKGKALKLAEAQSLSAGGIIIVGNFEYATNPTLTFGQGQADARTALGELVAMKAPRYIVYFSMDRDLYISEIPMVLNYLAGAANILGKGRVGVYGEYDLIEAAGRAGYVWLWQCYAWSHGKWSSYATCRQIRNGAWPGQYDADLNTAMADDIGGWILGQDYTPEDERDMYENDFAIPDDLVDDYAAAGIAVARGTKLSGPELGWRADLRGRQAQRAAADAGRMALQAKDAAEAGRQEVALLRGEIAALTALVKAIPGGVGGSGASATEVADEIARRIQQ